VIADRPQITQFEARQYNAISWEFYGQVEDDGELFGLRVALGGSIAEGYEAIVQEDGSFRIVIASYEPLVGIVTAQVVDYEGLQSELVDTLIPL
jgi:hypothetical protein